MTDAIIQSFTDQLLKALITESQYILQFQKELEEMKTKLDIMKAFLMDSDKVKRQYETLKKTLSALRELIYEADDLLIDCIIRADYRKNASFCFDYTPSEIYFRYQTGKKLKETNTLIEKMEQNLRSYLTPIVGQMSRDENTSFLRWTLHAFDQSEIVGLTADTRKIKNWILPPNETLQQVGIVGMGGLGKTTIAQKIFYDKEVERRFEKRIWLTVSQTFNKKEIMINILRQLGEDGSRCDVRELSFKIHTATSNRTYLIVMDDVWSIETHRVWWDELYTGLLKTTGHNNCIIITTRNEDTARSMGVEERRIHKPKVLNDEESWSLFCKIAFTATRGVCTNPRLKEVGQNIVEKCHGLPLAIKTIGGLLKHENQSEKWDRICANFYYELGNKENKSSVVASLQLSYDELPPQLKNCMLCFSIYPEDYEISTEQLVHWWVGEGFVQEKGQQTAIEVGFDCLAGLMSRCLVEVVRRRTYDGRAYSCKTHDLVRDMTIKIAREVAFSSFDEGETLRHKPAPDSRRLGLTSEMNLQPLESNSKLRAVLLMTGPISFNRNVPLSRVNSIRVLDLSNNKLDSNSIVALLFWISSLKRLAHLNLRGVAGLTELPYSIGKLQNLQLLVLSECNDLAKLPSSIATLMKLIVLDMENCPSLSSLPPGIGRLSNLQELSGFKLGSLRDGRHLSELNSLINLRVLRINISAYSEIADDELTVLSHLEKLQALSINTEDCGKRVLQKLDDLSPPPHLKELYLLHYNGEVTLKWIDPTSLCELRYLCIENGGLVHMSSNFWDCKDIKRELDEGDSKDIKWKLEGLRLMFLPSLQMDWETVERKMPLLRYVEVSHCYELRSFPCDVRNVGTWRKKEEE